MLRQFRQLLGGTGLWRYPVEDGVHLSMANKRGSVQHYFHFILGFVVPLVHAWPQVIARAGAGPVYVRSCMPMDPILRALKLNQLRILPVNVHKSMKKRAGLLRWTGPKLEFMTVPGFDAPDAYDPAAFEGVRETLFGRLKQEIGIERPAVEALFSGNGPHVLMIDRLPADPFYQSKDSEVKGSGAERRSIANMGDLYKLVQDRYASVAMVTLEGRSLYFQMALFSTADIILCQHGAAMVNLLWARRGVEVIEIISEPDRQKPLKLLYFSQLSASMGLRYSMLVQPEQHGPVNADDLAAVLEAVDQRGQGRAINT